jgi:hypothetical protein
MTMSFGHKKWPLPAKAAAVQVMRRRTSADAERPLMGRILVYYRKNVKGYFPENPLGTAK